MNTYQKLMSARYMLGHLKMDVVFAERSFVAKVKDLENLFGPWDFHLVRENGFDLIRAHLPQDSSDADTATAFYIRGDKVLLWRTGIYKDTWQDAQARLQDWVDRREIVT